MQRIALAALRPAAIHAVVVLGVSDGQLDRLATLEPSALRRGERLALAPMNHLYGRDIVIDATVAQTDERSCWLHAEVLQQRCRLLELRR